MLGLLGTLGFFGQQGHRAAGITLAFGPRGNVLAAASALDLPDPLALKLAEQPFAEMD